MNPRERSEAIRHLTSLELMCRGFERKLEHAGVSVRNKDLAEKDLQACTWLLDTVCELDPEIAKAAEVALTRADQMQVTARARRDANANANATPATAAGEVSTATSNATSTATKAGF